MRNPCTRPIAAVLLAITAIFLTGFTSQSSLPARDEEAVARLEASPRHAEWVEIEASGDKIDAFVVYPERAENAPVVLVIHEIYGLTDWVRGVADQLAAEGFIAIAPDVVSGKGTDGGGSVGLERDAAVALIRTLQPEEVTRRLNMAVDYATSLPAATDSFAVIGFCWGGSASFNFAVSRPDLGASAVYYGGSPDSEELRRIQAPVKGFYGGDDQRVNASIAPAQAEMDRLGKHYEPNIYEGAGHGFLRAQADRDGANMRASEQAWAATVAFFRAELEGS